jgi:hypothetical protein
VSLVTFGLGFGGGLCTRGLGAEVGGLVPVPTVRGCVSVLVALLAAVEVSIMATACVTVDVEPVADVEVEADEIATVATDVELLAEVTTTAVLVATCSVSFERCCL